ncbi:MAG: ABC transporter substrate-binding protein [Akkermansiaceae bacterium]|jgi:oligopeptide transport system substrate-binding protein|nr:ABC transporter substrate-binding protein [Akkermansiaceae bacterium]
MMFFRTISLVACLASVALLTCCKRPFSDRTQNLSVFRFSENGAPVTMDPVQSATQYANLMTTSIYDQLYEYKYLARPYQLKPRLAAALPKVSDDGLTYTIQIKKSILYADDECFPGGQGREVVAGDFVYSMQRLFDPNARSQGEWLWQGKIKGLDEWKKAGADYSKPIEGLQALGDHTIQIILNKPFPQLTYTFAMGFSSVTPREAVKYYGKEFGLNPVGSGPYKLKSFSTKKAVLVRNENYRDEIFDLEEEGYDPETQSWAGLERLDGRKLPIMDTTEVYFMKESMTRWNSLNKGTEIHFGGIPTELTHMVAEELNPLVLKPDYAKKFTAMNLPELGIVYLYLNMSDPKIGHHSDPEQNRRNLLLRKAISAAYDWPQRNRRYYNGIATLFPGTIPPGLDGYDNAFTADMTEPDFEKAKAYLKEGGWNADNLPVLDFNGVASVQNTQMFEQFRGWMEKIGYPREKIPYVPFATFGDFNKKVKQRDCTLIGMAWGLDYPDAENVLQLFYGPNSSPGSNSSNFNNPKYNKLFEESIVMQPGSERTEIYRKLNQIIIDDVPAVCGLSRNSPFIWHKNVVFLPSRNPHGSLFKYALVFDDSDDQ